MFSFREIFLSYMTMLHELFCFTVKCQPREICVRLLKLLWVCTEHVSSLNFRFEIQRGEVVNNKEFENFLDLVFEFWIFHVFKVEINLFIKFTTQNVSYMSTGAPDTFSNQFWVNTVRKIICIHLHYIFVNIN